MQGRDTRPADRVEIDTRTLSAAHFVVAVASCHGDEVIRALTAIYPGTCVRTVAGLTGDVIIAERGAGRIQLHADACGWAVVKGNVYDTLTDSQCDPATIAAAFFCDTPDLNRFEGEFTAVVHDNEKRITWAINDHASLLHLYYVERSGVLYVTTAPVAVARALRLGLNGAGLREFLWRGQVTCPNSLYAGMRRLDVGEHLRIQSGRWRIGRHWSAYHEPRAYANKTLAAEATAEIATAVARRYVGRGQVVADLTGGYDSRFVSCALTKAGAKLSVTVNGHSRSTDVVLARCAARTAGWPIRHYGAAFSGEMTSTVRREAARMSRGELGALPFYLHLATRPVLARDHVVHIQGGGGEFLRYNPWGQEFLGVGRRRRANIDRILRYRTLTGKALPDKVFATNFAAKLRSELRDRIATVIDEGAGTRTTQQLDAVFLLRMTGHFGGYTSSLYDLLPTAVPLMHRTALEHALSLPWKMRLSAGLLRRAIACLDPKVAALQTTYGGTAAPVTWNTLGREMHQVIGRFRHFADKVDRIVFNARIGQFVSLNQLEPPAPEPPFRTKEFWQFMDPALLYSRGLYEPNALARLVHDPSTTLEALSRIATLEQVCRDLAIEPTGELLGE
jgi:hypothetical protein